MDGMPRENTAVIFNLQQTWLLQVNYDLRWKKLIAPPRRTIQPYVVIRAQILSDALELAKVGQLDYSVALKV